MVLKFLRKIERFEYYNPGSFWGITVSFCLIFNLFTGQFVSSSTINSQFTPPIEICRGGGFGSNPLSPSGYRENTPMGDRGADREVPVSPRYDNTGESGAGNGGSSDSQSWDNEEVPPQSDYKIDPDYWKQYHPYFNNKEEEKEKEDSCLAQNKGGYDNLLIDLQRHRYDIEGRSAREELGVIAKDPKARQFLTKGLDRIKDGTLTSIQQKELKGFKHLKEYKFGRRGVRVIVNPGKKGEPDVIVGIVRRDRATPFIESLRNKFETTKRNN
jgi:hypothetical protein